MIVTVTNASSRTINALAEYTTLGTGPSKTTATGGARSVALPYPFGHVGEIAASGTKALPMHPRDWRYRNVPGQPYEAGEEWNQLVQRGYVTIAIGAQAGNMDQEELFVAEI